MSPALVTFSLYIAGVLVLAWLANRLLRHRSFLSEYFLGSRSLGMWAFAMTFAATSASGGSFTGFPAKIYTHGWIMALWISSYMVVPICMIGILGKRLNQVARISGAITVPDVFRDRFASPAFGILATALIVFFMSFNLVAQFKAGSLILRTVLDSVSAFHQGAAAVGEFFGGWELLHGVDPEYLLCLMAFGIVVVVYTAYGGFHAVVWTDVMQGIIMVAGVVILLPLALHQVGGLESATRQMAQMTPPLKGVGSVRVDGSHNQEVVFQAGTWIRSSLGSQGETRSPRLFKVARTATFEAGVQEAEVELLEIMTPGDVDRVLANQVVGSTPKGSSLTQFSPGPYAYGAGQTGTYVSGPGPSPSSSAGFLPLSLAVSFFIMWAIAGTGQPSHYVRLMAFRDTRTLRWSIITVTVHYSLIYFPLVIIFCCARILLPGMETEPDRIMPAIVVFITENAGLAWLGGLLVAAPFAAVMSTVDSFLLMISSALVRDVYQRNINPQVDDRRIRRLSYLVTAIVGAGAVLGAVNPPQFLQDIIVYTGSGLAACFLAPTVFALYWPRANTTGCMAGMACGFLAHVSMYTAGVFVNGSFFSPVRLAGMDPIIIGLAASFIGSYAATVKAAPPPEDLVERYFYGGRPVYLGERS